MKFFLIPFACLIIIFGACKKQKAIDPVNTITATVDGVDVNFSTDAFAYINVDSVYEYHYSLVINGETDTSNHKVLINFSVTSKNAITSGIFPSSDTSPGPVTFSQIIYEQAIPGSQLTWPYITNNSVPNSTTITISTISSMHVQGTFSGALISSIDGKPPKTVTNGKFDLVIK